MICQFFILNIPNYTFKSNKTFKNMILSFVAGIGV